MSMTLACSRCGLEMAIGTGNILPCVACGNAVFVPVKWLSWEVALTQWDKQFLAVHRIAPT